MALQCSNTSLTTRCAAARGLLRVCPNVRVLSIDVLALEPLSDMTDEERARHAEVVMDARLLTVESLGPLVFERFGLGRENVVFFGVEVAIRGGLTRLQGRVPQLPCHWQ